MITPEPTTATASGLRPSRIAGRTNSSSTAKLTTSAARAASPRHRPRTSTAAENSTASQASDPPRWKSTIWYEPGSSGSPPDQPSTTGSPTVNRGVPGSRGTIWTRSRPARGPSDMATTSAAQRPCPSPGEQSVVCTAVTCPRTGCCSGVAGGGRGAARGPQDDESDEGGERAGHEQHREEHADPVAGRRRRSVSVAVPVPGAWSRAASRPWPCSFRGAWWSRPASRRGVPLVAGPVRRDDGKGLGRGLRRGPGDGPGVMPVAGRHLAGRAMARTAGRTVTGHRPILPVPSWRAVHRFVARWCTPERGRAHGARCARRSAGVHERSRGGPALPLVRTCVRIAPCDGAGSKSWTTASAPSWPSRVCAASCAPYACRSSPE